MNVALSRAKKEHLPTCCRSTWRPKSRNDVLSDCRVEGNALLMFEVGG